jgi:hypothetical protein
MELKQLSSVGESHPHGKKANLFGSQHLPAVRFALLTVASLGGLKAFPILPEEKKSLSVNAGEHILVLIIPRCPSC